jgi:hypothetical protein
MSRGSSESSFCEGGIGNNGVYWKRKAKIRDGSTCRRCGNSEERIQRKGDTRCGETVSNLHGHHVIPIEMFENEEDAHSLDNLVTVCVDCHRKLERRFYRMIVKLLGMRKIEDVRSRLLSKLHPVPLGPANEEEKLQ